MAKRGGFPGMGGGMNMNAMIKQAQKMQQQMVKAQEEIAEMEHSATVGGGVVTATVKGTNTLQGISISPDVLDPDDVEMLEDLIVSAVNEAMKKAQEQNEAIMGKVTGGAGMPGLL